MKIRNIKNFYRFFNALEKIHGAPRPSGRPPSAGPAIPLHTPIYQRVMYIT